ncbi:hypothetical protein ACGFNU_50380 [Spirillospora sp. NPDC048911]|uniref:hypothetical protein n=1 Tax=Spirillospora sp. NPDC048911 TaxID=3364527 RepID=UPI00371CBA7F
MHTLPRRFLTLFGGAVLAIGLTGSPAHAVTSEHNNAVQTSAPSNPTFCINEDITQNAARACWVANGDDWYVQDTRADGHSASVSWEDWACNDGGSFPCNDLRRKGICRNTFGAGTWAWCNKDYTESDAIYFKAAQTEGWSIIDSTPLWVACRPHTSCH